MIIYQGVSGDLYFSLLSSPTPALVQTDFKARNGTPLSSGLWVDAKGATETYLYYIAEDNILSDAIYAGGKWASGNLRNIKLKPHPESKLASVLWLEGAGKSSQWIYFQDNDGYILEYGRLMGVGNPWNGGPDNSSEVSLLAMAGSGFGLSYDILGRASQRLRIYAQVPNGTVVSRDYSSQLAQKWLDPYPVYTPPTTTPNEKIVDISAATERNGNGELLSIRLLFAAQEGRLRELSFDNSTGWDTVPLDVAVKTQARVAAGVSQGNNITAYFQEAGEEALSLANLGPDGRWNVRTAGIN
ncbi:hypothetical protein FN846DRAFT_615747 [Sphaerosporella brunnea]|uniref:Uncharacterized protein n=1 Tax=Sphaerosporella brunnea TaxID=1250544 RepID=A0A5J5F248_9PEZI|nr:hypothetical protein FN846DRAFT_615747 [Sphaerosporella brunnea]